MNGFGQDLRYSFRALRGSLGFTVSAILVLMLGIGANTAIFSVVNAVLLRPLPFRDSELVVTVLHVPPAKAFPGVKTFSVSPANYIDWRAQADVFEAMAAFKGETFSRTESDRAESVRATVAESSFFDVLKMETIAGRLFRADECQPGRDDVTVLSFDYAQERFGSAAAAVGQTLRLSGRPFRIVGVLSPEFRVRSWGPADNKLFVPLTWSPEERAVRSNHNHAAIARIKHGRTVAQAQSQMDVISSQLARQYPEENTGWGAVVTPLRDELVGDVRPALLVLLGAVSFVLLIACANVGNLVLARTLSRRKELAIRVALGASQTRALRTVLVETTLLSLAGGALGLLFAEYAVALVVATLASQLPRATEVALDWRVLIFTFGISVLTGLAAGALATWRSSRLEVSDSLKQGLGKTDSVSGGRRTRSSLVVAEVALSLMLLVGAGLLLRSLWALQNVNPGFDSRNVATVDVPFPPTDNPEHLSRLHSTILPAVRALPGVDSAGGIDTLPLTDGGSHQPVVIEGRPAEVFALQPNVDVRAITPGYARALRVPILRGRDVTDADMQGKVPVILISESMARSYWPDEDPMGKRLTLSFSPEVKRRVVGVVGDVRLYGIDILDPVPMIYIPALSNMFDSIKLVVRGSQDAERLLPAIAGAVSRIDPQSPARSLDTMDGIVERSLSARRFSMFLFASFAGLALLLAAVGIYSVLAYNVRRRLHEISIRMAVGAQVPDILQLIVVEGMRPAAIGAVLGVCGAYVGGEILSSMIYGVSTTDPLTFAAVVVVLGAVALLACVIPALRAARVQPASSLRSE